MALFIESSHMGHIEEGHLVLQHLVSFHFAAADREASADSPETIPPLP